MDVKGISKQAAGAFLIFGMAATAACQAGPPADKVKSGNSKTSTSIDAGLSVSLNVGISVGEAHAQAARYGLTGAKPLPPGIRKNLARGKPIPPGIQKTRLPGPFLAQLPQHEGHQWLQTGSDLVLVVSGSLVISDVLAGVFN